MSNWFYSTDGKQKTGPVTTSHLQQLARSGQLRPTDMLWQEGMPKWKQAATAQDIFPDTHVLARPIHQAPP
jgi:hypothetical protein